jgi:hypothetical protein
MATNLEFSRLGGSNADFQQMIKRFGVVTVMNARVYEPLELEGENGFDHLSASAILGKYCTVTGGKITWNDATITGDNAKPLLCRLDTLKIANATQEGPTKTVSGGQYSNPLIKFGKSMRLEMQDALGDARALDALCGTVSEVKGASSATQFSNEDYNRVYALHVTEDFNGPKLIVGDTFFIDQKTGQQIPALIVFYQFLPDSIFNLTQDAEGDATVFDMNGDVLTTNIIVQDKKGEDMVHGVFYSIVDPAEVIAANQE